MALYTETINKLFQTDITSYQIAKDLCLSPQYIDNYRTGRSKIENMRLGKAELLVDYYNGLAQEKYMKNERSNFYR